VLNGGLEILKTEDLREALSGLIPFLRLYGRLDGLVPRKIVATLDARWPQSQSLIFPKPPMRLYFSPGRFLQRIDEFNSFAD
jgi:pimeloyl-[acyl-carrier protein] methyl ester esterase